MFEKCCLKFGPEGHVCLKLVFLSPRFLLLPYIEPNDLIGLSTKLHCLIIELLLEKVTAAKRKKLKAMTG